MPYCNHLGKIEFISLYKAKHRSNPTLTVENNLPVLHFKLMHRSSSLRLDTAKDPIPVVTVTYLSWANYSYNESIECKNRHTWCSSKYTTARWIDLGMVDKFRGLAKFKHDWLSIYLG